MAFLLFIPVAELQGRDPLFSQFYAAPIYLNPAFAGSTACSRLGLNYRHWNSIDNFHVINASFDTYIEQLEGGIGVIVTSDLSHGHMAQTNLGMMYSYHARLSQDQFLHLAVQAGYIRNDQRLSPQDFASWPDNPEPITEDYRGHDVGFSAGALYFSDKVYGGVAVHHLNNPDMSLYEAHEDRQGRKYTAHMGMYFEPGQHRGRPVGDQHYFISPNVIYQRESYHQHISGGIYAGSKPLMAGLWLRHHRYQSRTESGNETQLNTLVALVGINAGDYRIGLSYDYPVGSSEVRNLMTVFELSLAYRFACPQRNIRGGIINSPNF